MPPNLRLSDELIDLMKDFSLSTGYRWCLGDTAAPIDALRRALRAMVKSACPRRTNKGLRPHADEVIQGRRRGIIVFRSVRMREKRYNGVLRQLGPDIQWLQSYVADDKTFCVYLATDEAIIRKHAEISGFPATKITEIRNMIDPTTEKSG
jgi:hypothetical protein